MRQLNNQRINLILLPLSPRYLKAQQNVPVCLGTEHLNSTEIKVIVSTPILMWQIFVTSCFMISNTFVNFVR